MPLTTENPVRDYELVVFVTQPAQTAHEARIVLQGKISGADVMVSVLTADRLIERILSVYELECGAQYAPIPAIWFVCFNTVRLLLYNSLPPSEWQRYDAYVAKIEELAMLAQTCDTGISVDKMRNLK